MDISWRREKEAAEARLRNERDVMLRIAVESSPSGLVLASSAADGKILLVNAAIERVRCRCKSSLSLGNIFATIITVCVPFPSLLFV